MTGSSLPGHPNVTTVTSRQEFEREAQRLRNSGYIEVPGALGGGSDGGIQYGWADYINSRLECNCGDDGKASVGHLPLLHVSSGIAVPVTAENGYKGNMITWGAGNRLPNVISLLCSLLPYPAAALKFNIDMCCGMGPRPMYAFTQYVGGNITHKTIPYETADKLILGLIRDLQMQLVKLEEEHPEVKEREKVKVNSEEFAAADEREKVRVKSEEFAAAEEREKGRVNSEEFAAADSGGAVQFVAVPQQQNQWPDSGDKSAAEQMHDDIEEQIAQLRKDLAVWQETNRELFGDPDGKTPEERQGFLGRNNLLQTYQQLYSDMLQYNICFPEFELQQTYIDPQTGHEVKGFKWEPKIVGLKWRNAKTMRLDQMNAENRIDHVFVSNRWLTSSELTNITKDNDQGIDAMPALSYQSPALDLARLTRDTRRANADKRQRPTHVVMPVTYNEYGHPYYPVPAWYSIFSGDVYTYASLLISDRKKRRDNANVVGRILYLNDDYVQRLYSQRNLVKDEDKIKFFNDHIIAPINNFLKNRDNSGKPMLAYTFTGADGKTYKSWEIVEIEENSKAAAEANKEELAEISSVILFAWGVDSPLIGNTPGTTVRSGGTDLRERYLLKQINMATLQTLVLNALNVVKTHNRLDDHLCWQIKKEVLTTLDNSKTGITEAETT